MRAQTRLRTTKPRSASAGFTLLEVLLTSLLASVVLVALWSLSDIYLRMFASGKRKVEETQLVRGLTGQLAKDLSEVLQLPENPAASSSQGTPAISPPPASPGLRGSRMPLPPGMTPGALRSPAPNPTSTSSPPLLPGSPPGANPLTSPGTPLSAGETNQRQNNQLVPRFGLFGTKQALRLIVLQTDPRTTRAPVELTELLPQPGQLRTPFATELRTILYTFAPHRESSPNDRQHPGGLVRREWAWELWSGMRMASLPSSSSESSSSLLPESQTEWGAEDAVSLELERDLYHVPQVTGLEFRYYDYDGQKWEIEWDSWERRQLPLLVEVLLKIKTTIDEHSANPSEDLPDESEESTSLADESSAGSSSTSSSQRGRVYRRLIRLPFAEESRGLERRDRDLPSTEMADSIRPVPPLRGGRQ